MNESGGQAGGTSAGLLALLLFAGLTTASAQTGRFISVDDDPVLGDPRARVTIIEFGDYQCPFCRAFWKNTRPA